MPSTILPDSTATWPSSNPELPPDLHETHPIIARHYFGLELREVREIFWDLARLGYRLPAEKGVILIDGERR